MVHSVKKVMLLHTPKLNNLLSCVTLSPVNCTYPKISSVFFLNFFLILFPIYDESCLVLSSFEIPSTRMFMYTSYLQHLPLISSPLTLILVTLTVFKKEREILNFSNFDVVLTVHLSIISTIDQLNAEILVL